MTGLFLDEENLYYNGYFMPGGLCEQTIISTMEKWSNSQNQYFVCQMISLIDNYQQSKYPQQFTEYLGRVLDKLFRYAILAGFTKNSFVNIEGIVNKYPIGRQNNCLDVPIISFNREKYFSIIDKNFPEEEEIPLLPELMEIVNDYLRLDLVNPEDRLGAREKVDFIIGYIHAKEISCNRNYPDDLKLLTQNTKAPLERLIGKISWNRITDRIQNYFTCCYPLFEDEILEFFRKQILLFHKVNPYIMYIPLPYCKNNYLSLPVAEDIFVKADELIMLGSTYDPETTWL